MMGRGCVKDFVYHPPGRSPKGPGSAEGPAAGGSPGPGGLRSSYLCALRAGRLRVCGDASRPAFTDMSQSVKCLINLLRLLL